MNEAQKPNAAGLRWEIRDSECPYANQTLKLRVDTISVGGSQPTTYGYLERAEAVIIVPITRDGQMMVVRQYRYPVDQWCVEVPAGGTHDTGGESLREVAQKELREEVGATSAALTYVGFFFSAPSLTDEKCHVFLAENVEITREPKPEESEEIEPELVDADAAVERARSGEMKNAPCALAVLWCEPLLRSRGYI